MVERNHHLTLFNRVGSYHPEDLEGLFSQGRAFEYLANARCILPVESFTDFWPIMLQARANASLADDTLRQVMADVLAHVRAHGATAPRDVGADGPRLMGIGYNPPDVASKASGRAIDLLWLGGHLMVAGRRGNEKVYDLTERVLPGEVRSRLPEAEVSPGDDAPLRPWSTPAVAPGGRAPWGGMLLRRYLSAFRLADPGDFRFGWQKWPAAERRAAAEALAARGHVVRVEIEGVRRVYYALPSVAAAAGEADSWTVEPEVRLVPPLDPLLWRRERLRDLFAFDYVWEVYVPESRRRFGYYTMPVLYGDRLVGRVDPKLHRAEGLLELRRVGFEDGFTPDDAFVETAAGELARFAAFHQARRLKVDRIDGDRPQRSALRAVLQAANRHLRRHLRRR
ncbi:MAG TPA: crosslink repair DNA glycosylase YcaQ family protein [Bacillota bacterium]